MDRHTNKVLELVSKLVVHSSINQTYSSGKTTSREESAIEDVGPSGNEDVERYIYIVISTQY